MVISDQYSIMSPSDSPTAQHWEGRPASVKENILGKTGRLAPRWVHDLLNSDLDSGSFARIDWDREARCSSAGVPHRLVLVGNQSTAEGRNPGILSCVCCNCDFHFIIRTSWDSDQLVCLCRPLNLHFPPKETDFYLHHLVNVKEPIRPTTSVSDYHPMIREALLAVEHFACSAPRCTFQVSVEISRPRLKREWVRLLLDKQRILDNLVNARKHSPERFADARDDWSTTAPSTLNTYLRDLLDKPNPRNISRRNKRFQVVFGDECHAIFRAIQFTEENLDKDGVFEPYFIPPRLEPGTPGTPTKLSTLRAFIEDLQAEAESLIIRSGKPGENRPYVGNRLFKELQCFEYPQNKVPQSSTEAHRVLGVLPDFDKALVFFAYNRQSTICEKRRQTYVEALRDIALLTADEDFQTRAIQELTIVEGMPPPSAHGPGNELETQAYSFFSLQYTASDDNVVSAYNTKLEHSPSQADFAREMLQIIGRHRSSDRILTHANAPMDVSSAYRILEADPQWPDNTIVMLCSVKLNKDPKSKSTAEVAIKAMDAIASDRNSDEIRQAVKALEQEYGRPPQQEKSEPIASPNTSNLPVGLENIGNTCYLNSILQYLNTVVPIKDLLAHYPAHELGLDDLDIQRRLIGGNKLKIDRAEAVVARVFVEELDRLLNELGGSQASAIRPSQRLANAVLLPTSNLTDEPGPQAKTTNAAEQKTLEVMGTQFPAPPPLPARPPPGPPAQKSEQVEDIDMVNVTVDPVSESASSVSSQTLVSMSDIDNEKRDFVPEDKTDIRIVSQPIEPPAPELVVDTDVKMTGVESPVLNVEQRVLKALETQTRTSGTEQQDVEEVMGSIINRLQAAIRPTRTDPTDGIQWEPIMETFYVELTNHTKFPNQDKYKLDSTLERAITAYPAEAGPTNIHDGLSRNFDLQRVVTGKEDIMRFTSIKRLPPILHVLIQRTQNNGNKNMNPVEVFETLYLDRYMDTPEDPQFFKLRQKGWALQQRLEQLNNISTATAEDVEIMDSFVNDFVHVNKADVPEPDSLLGGMPASSLAFAGEDSLFPTYNQSEASFEKIEPPETTGFIVEGRQQINNMRVEEVKTYKAELEELFSQHKTHAYRLHAVICHSGQLRAGHYWVWIHDFDTGVWRKYNDRTVTETPNTEEVLKTLNSNGDPYYLCYVQAGKEHDLVKIPKRSLPTSSTQSQEEPLKNTAKSGEEDADGDIDLIEMDGQVAGAQPALTAPPAAGRHWAGIEERDQT
ncbi:Putative ubiquitin specific protease, UCH repeated domain, ubiquitin carboxyl-terminal hydrolase 14 [Colletotrichum destructivum]|uniref:ubiquitinyl hydrolase 1 n=1 Tax=Colletotrichum destructivum TaxID=34406 RepID=A0AAX4I5K8_9PEZI|nr:Putative ubiquitin specific protease, UCH repeated domain, ubiquitin carboxyl-terminal hydrolase 14 [Colletotrichum destructivum]